MLIPNSDYFKKITLKSRPIRLNPQQYDTARKMSNTVYIG